MKDFLLSVIIPVFNEEGNIGPLLDRLLPIVDRYNYEIIFVNDGSRDSTVADVKSYATHNKHLKLVSFQRNFGHQMALSAGYGVTKGDCVVTIDADLQDPPEIIPEMIEEWQKGTEVVYAKRKKREVDSFFKKTTAQAFYRFINFLSDVPIPEDVGDYRLIDKKVVEYLNTLSETPDFLRGLVAWGGFKSSTVYFERAKRHAGETHYPLKKMINFAMQGITAFSTVPLRLATYMGFAAAVIGFLAIIRFILGRLFWPEDYVPGWTSLFVGIMFIGGIQLITIGIIGEYIAKIYKEVQKRPRYLIKETVNI
jgi:dolichol-phosphate mannosyltransferase